MFLSAVLVIVPIMESTIILRLPASLQIIYIFLKAYCKTNCCISFVVINPAGEKDC